MDGVAGRSAATAAAADQCEPAPPRRFLLSPRRAPFGPPKTKGDSADVTRSFLRSDKARTTAEDCAAITLLVSPGWHIWRRISPIIVGLLLLTLFYRGTTPEKSAVKAGDKTVGITFWENHEVIDVGFLDDDLCREGACGVCGKFHYPVQLVELGERGWAVLRTQHYGSSEKGECYFCLTEMTREKWSGEYSVRAIGPLEGEYVCEGIMLPAVGHIIGDRTPLYMLRAIKKTDEIIRRKEKPATAQPQVQPGAINQAERPSEPPRPTSAGQVVFTSATAENRAHTPPVIVGDLPPAGVTAKIRLRDGGAKKRYEIIEEEKPDPPKPKQTVKAEKLPKFTPEEQAEFDRRNLAARDRWDAAKEHLRSCENGRLLTPSAKQAWSKKNGSKKYQPTTQLVSGKEIFLFWDPEQKQRAIAEARRELDLAEKQGENARGTWPLIDHPAPPTVSGDI